MSNSEISVNSSITINNRDPELLRAYQNVIKDHRVDAKYRALVSEIQETLDNINQEPESKRRSTLAELGARLIQLKEVADNCESLIKYGLVVWKLIQPFI